MEFKKTHVPGSKEEEEYLRYLMKKYSSKRFKR
jgi:hypothetical protein